jgi:DNA modification methylase
MIITGNALDSLAKLGDEVAQSCVTSPPFYGLRSYLDDEHPDKPLEIGSESTVDAYIANLVDVFGEVRRVLRKDGTLWLNMGDSFFRAKDLDPFLKKFFKPIGIKRKSLAMTPFRLAIALQEDGWLLRSVIPWVKGSVLPEGVKDRPTSAVEYWFLLTKQPNYFMDMEAIRKVTPGSTSKAGRNRRNSDWFFESMEFIRDQSGIDKTPELSPMGDVEYKDHLDDHLTKKGPGPLFTQGGDLAAMYVNNSNFRGAHFATFPANLIKPMIMAGTSEQGGCSTCGSPRKRIVKKGKALEEWKKTAGADSTGTYSGKSVKDHKAHGVQDASEVKRRILEGMKERLTVGWDKTCKCSTEETKPQVVLDPFFGAGTTGLVAKELGRRWIGCEISEEFVEIAEKRIKDFVPTL